MAFLMMKVLECLLVMKDVDLSIKRPCTLSPEIVEFILVVIEVVTMDNVNIGLNLLSTFPISIVEQVLMVMVEVEIGLR